MQNLILKVLNKLKDADKTLDNLRGTGVDLIEFLSDYTWAIQYLFSYILTDEGFELVYWWLYDGSDKILGFDSLEESINVEKTEDFVNYLFSNPLNFRSKND